MRIIVVGGAGTIGKAAVKALSDRHEVVVAGRRSGTMHVDIRSPDSVRAMYHQVGSFDALVCAAGDAPLGPFDNMSEAEFLLGIESKLLGQIRLVLQGRSLISDGGSFTLVRPTLSTPGSCGCTSRRMSRCCAGLSPRCGRAGRCCSRRTTSIPCSPPLRAPTAARGRGSCC